MTSICPLDYNTIFGGDKFGNVFTLRLPENCNDNVDNPTGNRILWDQGLLNGAPNKVEVSNSYHLGEVPTCVVKCKLFADKSEITLVSTIMGGLYAFVPFRSPEDTAFFQHLEMFMRQEYVNICQRDHLSYRSYFMPVKDTIDGDLCERFSALPYSKQEELASDIDRTTIDILKKLEDTRALVL